MGKLVEIAAAAMLSCGMLIRSGSINESARTCDFVASTDAVDSYDEIVEQDWRLERYRSNPIVLYGHNSYSRTPIGKSIRTDVVTTATGRKQLECTIQFAKTASAEEIWQLVKDEVLRAVSVGFVPGEYRLEKRNGQDVYVCSNNELYEISVVPIPANPEALAKMRARARAEFDEKSGHEGHQETDMTLEQALARIAQLEADGKAKDADITTDRASLVAERSARAMAEGQIKEIASLVNQVEGETVPAAVKRELTSARTEAKAKQRALDESEVNALVGIKIQPFEKEALLELAEESPKAFAKHLANAKARPDLKLLGVVVPPDPKPKNQAAGPATQGKSESLI